MIEIKQKLREPLTVWHVYTTKKTSITMYTTRSIRKGKKKKSFYTMPITPDNTMYNIITKTYS